MESKSNRHREQILTGPERINRSRQEVHGKPPEDKENEVSGRKFSLHILHIFNFLQGIIFFIHLFSRDGRHATCMSPRPTFTSLIPSTKFQEKFTIDKANFWGFRHGTCY